MPQERPDPNDKICLTCKNNKASWKSKKTGKEVFPNLRTTMTIFCDDNGIKGNEPFVWLDACPKYAPDTPKRIQAKLNYYYPQTQNRI